MYDAAFNEKRMGVCNFSYFNNPNRYECDIQYCVIYTKLSNHVNHKKISEERNKEMTRPSKTFTYEHFYNLILKDVDHFYKIDMNVAIHSKNQFLCQKFIIYRKKSYYINK